MKSLLLLATALGGLALLSPQAAWAQDTKITIGTDVDAGTLDPRLTTDTTAYRTVDLIYAGLVTLTPSLEAKPDLAESWESPDPTTYVFHLRKGLKFSDGSPLTADDVVYTFKRFWDKDLASGAPAVLAFLDPEGIKAVDAHTVSFTTKQPVVELPVLITNKFTNIVAEGAKHEDLRLKGNGTGPFMQEQFQPNAPVRM